MRQKTLLDNHERKITEELGFMLAMNGYINRGSIADGTLFSAKNTEGVKIVTITRRSKGLFRTQRTYTATIYGERTETFSDVAYLAEIIVTRVLDGVPAQAS